MMNFFVYGCGLLAYWLIGFAIQMGGAAGNANLGGLQPLASEHSVSLFGKTWGIFGGAGMFLSGHTYDVGVMVIFLFEMVFMDTALTIVTGACAERWKFITFSVASVLMGAFTYPIFGNWAWGAGWLSQLGTNLGLGKGYCDFAGSGVVHSVGGITALAVCLIVGPQDVERVLTLLQQAGETACILGKATDNHDKAVTLTRQKIVGTGHTFERFQALPR